MGPFTYQYQQPDAYHFCQDSVLFPQFVTQALQVAIDDDFQTLDVCAGCGVLGFELAFHEPRLKKIDFLEIQNEFREYFEQNRIIAGRGNGFRFWQANYEILLKEEHAQKYDLIIANPPYFYQGEGRLSPSELQNRCRFFLDSDLKNLLLGCANALKPTGQAFLLVKSGKAHGRSALREGALALSGKAQIEVVGQIRGTDVVRLRPL
jgi:tRNA1Val (adenine37-N6)-methyltransferase